MKVMIKKEIEVVGDIRCDVCGCSTSKNGRHSPQFGTLHAHWGYGAHHDGKAYEVHLCESCFFQILANLQELRRGELMISKQGGEPNPDFGRVLGHTPDLT